MTDTIVVQERGQRITFTFDDVMRYHGVHSPGGVAVAFKAMQRAFPLVSPTSRPAANIVVRTAFRGPGARDCFEAVTRAVSDDRYTVDRSLVRTDRGRLIEDFVFELSIGDRMSPCCCATGSSPPNSSTWPAQKAAPKRRNQARRAESATGATRHRHTRGRGFRRRVTDVS